MLKKHKTGADRTSPNRILFTHIWHYCTAKIPRCGVPPTEGLDEWVAKSVLLLRL